MEKVPFGSIKQALGINRANVADNMKGKAILLDPDPAFKNVAFDDRVKRSVEVTQEMVLKHGLNPRSVYLFLIARLNTDMKGNVIGDDIVIEYVQFSENLYRNYVDAVEATGVPMNGMVLKKVSKSVDGRDFSYVEGLPANIKVEQGVKEQLNKIVGTAGAIDAMWSMVDAASTTPVKEYEAKLLEYYKEHPDAAPEAIELPAPKTKAQAIEAAKEVAKEFEDENDDFGTEKPEFGQEFVAPESIKVAPVKTKEQATEEEIEEVETEETSSEFDEE